ncbi:MAG: non-homologous end-joining DNA ligase [Candidatus Binatia bacterium]
MAKRLRHFGPYTIEISNPEKLFFPDSDLTKGDLIEYYEQIAPVMLPHLRDRLVTMHRFPDGIKGEDFYQKDVPDYFPAWIKTVTVEKEEGYLVQLVIQNTASLVYLANQACITLHVWPSRVDRRHHPDRMIFDLDPSGEDFGAVREAARALRSVLAEVGLLAFVMTTGSRGLHVTVPLDRRSDFTAVRGFATQVAELVVGRNPQRFTTQQPKNKRHGRVFLDVLRNAYAQHAVAPYAVRAQPGAPVATPIGWEELDDHTVHARSYTMRNLFRRLGQKEDPWKDMARHARALTHPRRRLQALLDSDKNEQGK